MICKICKTETEKIFDAKIMNKYKIDYFYCQNCGFLQTEGPYWLTEAYKKPINISDTGYLQRNIFLSKKVTILLFFFFDKNKKFLDYASGYGVFVRLMRDIGFDFYWSDKYTQNIFARAFEYNDSIKNNIEAITCFEAFEHFVNPIEEIEKMLSISKNIIFTTELLPQPIPKPEDWWYYGLEHGQHISFYSQKTFNFIANKYSLNYSNSGSLHILSQKRISNFKLKILKFTKFGLHKFIQKQLKSKTWEDHLKMSNNNETNVFTH
jgi:hypothetical protein